MFLPSDRGAREVEENPGTGSASHAGGAEEIAVGIDVHGAVGPSAIAVLTGKSVEDDFPPAPRLALQLEDGAAAVFLNATLTVAAALRHAEEISRRELSLFQYADLNEAPLARRSIRVSRMGSM